MGALADLKTGESPSAEPDGPASAKHRRKFQQVIDFLNFILFAFLLSKDDPVLGGAALTILYLIATRPYRRLHFGFKVLGVKLNVTVTSD